MSSEAHSVTEPGGDGTDPTGQQGTPADGIRRWVHAGPVALGLALVTGSTLLLPLAVDGLTVWVVSGRVFVVLAYVGAVSGFASLVTGFEPTLVHVAGETPDTRLENLAGWTGYGIWIALTFLGTFAWLTFLV